MHPFCRVRQTPFPSEPCDAIIQWLSFAPLAQWAANSAVMIVNAQIVYVSALNYCEASGNPEMLAGDPDEVSERHAILPQQLCTVCLVTCIGATIISSPPRDLFWLLFPFPL